MRQWHEEGKLDESQALIMSHTREIEELYDLEKDPDELHNLARDAAYGTQLVELRGRLIEWQKRSGDTHGVESPEIYEAEAGAEHLEGGKGNRSPQYQKNLELMKRWHTEKPFVPLSP